MVNQNDEKKRPPKSYKERKNEVKTLLKDDPDKLLNILQNDPEEFKRLINYSADNLQKVAEKFPEQENTIFDYYFKNPNDTNEFPILFSNRNLSQIFSIFKNHHRELLDLLYNHPDECDTILVSYFDLGIISTTLNPDLKNQLFTHILEDDINCKRIFSSKDSIIFAAKNYSNHDKLLSHVFKNADDRKNIVPSVNDLVTLSYDFPNHKHILFTLFLSDSDSRARLIKDAYDLNKIAKQFPEQKDALLDSILGNPEEFKKIFGTYITFKEDLIKNFPNYKHILSQLTTEKALEAAKAAALTSPQAKAFAQGAAQGAFSSPTSNTPFKFAELANLLGLYLDKKDGSSLLVNKDAAKLAGQKKEGAEKNHPSKFKK